MNTPKRIQIHRFRETVAISPIVSGSETLYLSLTLAKALAAELVKYADDVETEKFSQSPLGATVVYDDELIR